MTAGMVSAAADRPPVLSSIGSKTVNEGKLLSFTISAKDPDGNKVTYSATGLPKGAKLGATTGKFTWTPASGTAGKYTVKFIAKANGKTDSETIKITVKTTSFVCPLKIVNKINNKITVVATKVNSKNPITVVNIPALKTRDVTIPAGSYDCYILMADNWYRALGGPFIIKSGYTHTWTLNMVSGGGLKKIPKSEAPKI